MTKIIDPKYGQDDQPLPKSRTRGEESDKTPVHEGSQDTDHPTELIDEHEPQSTVSRRSRRARRPTEFYQSGLDYINYTNACEPRSYEEVRTTSDADTLLQAMKSKMESDIIGVGDKAVNAEV